MCEVGRHHEEPPYILLKQPSTVLQNGKRVHHATRILSARASLTSANSWSLLVSVIFIVVFCAVAWFASPKGENQTYVPYPSQSRAATELYPRRSCARAAAAFPLTQDIQLTPLRSQCLALDSHPLCLELLAHVGYVLLQTFTPRQPTAILVFWAREY
jgi:hypothetical protein